MTNSTAVSEAPAKLSGGARLLTRFVEKREKADAKGPLGRGTRARLAASCGMLPEQLSHVLYGRRLPTLAQAYWIEKTAGVPMSSWFQK